MTSSGQISDLRGIKWNLYFWNKSYPKIQFLSILDKYFKSYGNINAIWPLFGMGSSQIWPCHVTQAENLSFPYLKSYCPLDFRKSHQISWFCYIPNGNYKEDNLKEPRERAPPPPPHVETISIKLGKKVESAIIQVIVNVIIWLKRFAET